MDATLAIIAAEGFRGVSIASVAVAAGVSRQTVYSVFGTREDMVSQSMITLASEVLDAIRTSLESIQDPTEFLVEFVVAARTTVRDHAVLATLLKADVDNPLNEGDAIARAKPVVLELLSPIKAMNSDVVPMMDDIAQMLIRLGLSVILFADDAIDADDDLRAFLTRWLSPVLPPGRQIM